MDPQDWKLLIVDDESDIREVMALALEDAGYRVETASDGSVGLRICAEASPQILITDIRMPKMDGIQLLETVKQRFPAIEVIVMTAFGEMDMAIRALQLDASDFITKPVNSEALTLALKRAQDRFVARKKLKDYTELLEREVEDQARLLHQDKMLSLGRLAASVVHEINNPLSGILNYIRLMQRIMKRGDLDAQQREKFARYLDLVETETARCSQIVSGLLAFSRKSEPSFSKVRVEEVITRCVALSRHRLELQQIVLETHLADDLPPIRGDMNQLQQCIINLVFNAIDAMPNGGTLAIGAVVRRDDDVVSITVSDTGTGIPVENQNRVFQPFFTTKKDGHGVGLGLSTVAGIMEHHHGAVSLESLPGKGATFTLTVPLAADADAP